MKWLIFVPFLAAALFSGSVCAASTRFQDLAVDVRGSGRPVVMIPGLNSAGETWAETCEAVQPAECHMVHLPGFAGREPIETDRFLETMRDQIIAYARDRKLGAPVFVGHSLGGILSLMIALKAPDVPARLVIVDSLPFYPAIGNPSATADGMESMAQIMRYGILSTPETEYRAQVRQNVAAMSRSADRVRLLEQWSANSARGTSAQAWYELATTDLRGSMSEIHQPTVVLGSWAEYAKFGATLESTAAMFRNQYAGLQGMELKMSEKGYHFLMWDDSKLVNDTIRDALKR